MSYIGLSARRQSLRHKFGSSPHPDFPVQVARNTIMTNRRPTCEFSQVNVVWHGY